MEQQNNESKGALIGSMIIVVILVLGGIYFAKQIGQDRGSAEIDAVLQEDAELQAVESAPVEDEIPAIESDLEEINLDDLNSLDIDSLEF